MARGQNRKEMTKFSFWSCFDPNFLPNAVRSNQFNIWTGDHYPNLSIATQLDRISKPPPPPPPPPQNTEYTWPPAKVKWKSGIMDMNLDRFLFAHLLNFSPIFHLSLPLPVTMDMQVQERRVITVYHFSIYPYPLIRKTGSTWFIESPRGLTRYLSYFFFGWRQRPQRRSSICSKH